VSAALSLLILALVWLALLSLGLTGGAPKDLARRFVAMTTEPQGEKREKPTKTAAPQKSAAKQAVAVPLPPVPVPTQAPTQLIKLSHEEFAASDIAMIGKKRAEQASAESAANTNGTYGPGGGPNGARLYAAAWYREPSNAELRPFLTGASPEGAWATIACQTVERYHVENCQELDEYPLGSGLARGLRRAAWQFLVQPPRVDGKPQLGVWVRIRFDFTKNGRAPD